VGEESLLCRRLQPHIAPQLRDNIVTFCELISEAHQVKLGLRLCEPGSGAIGPECRESNSDPRDLGTHVVVGVHRVAPEKLL
jgi:hypothetical protein